MKFHEFHVFNEKLQKKDRVTNVTRFRPETRYARNAWDLWVVLQLVLYLVLQLVLS